LKAIAVAAFGHVPVASINKTGWISPVDFELLLKEPPWGSLEDRNGLLRAVASAISPSAYPPKK
jgi:hypothetical protein